MLILRRWDTTAKFGQTISRGNMWLIIQILSGSKDTIKIFFPLQKIFQPTVKLDNPFTTVIHKSQVQKMLKFSDIQH